MRFLRIQPVQKVIHNPTQLSGRGFPHIFYMRSILSQFYVFFVLQSIYLSSFRLYRQVSSNVRCCCCVISAQ